MMKTRLFGLKVVSALAGLSLLGVLAAYVVLSLHIGATVRATSDAAMRLYAGDRVEALVRYVEDSSHLLRDRNRAVWALGQLGDPRALPALRKHRSGEPCDHATCLCQRELDKAIRLLEGGMNASPWVWRRGPAYRSAS